MPKKLCSLKSVSLIKNQTLEATSLEEVELYLEQMWMSVSTNEFMDFTNMNGIKIAHQIIREILTTFETF